MKIFISSVLLKVFQALFLRTLAAFKLNWAVILAESQDPFSGAFNGQQSRDWLDEWFAAHRVRII